MKAHLAATTLAALASLACTSIAVALPVQPAAIPVAIEKADVEAALAPTKIHHRPWHTGGQGWRRGRGLRLGWYKRHPGRGWAWGRRW